MLFIFTVQRQGLWRGLCSVCVQARTKSVFISYARVRKSWEILFSYECCTSLVSNGEARGEGFALDATRSICFFSSIFYIYFQSLSIYFHWFSLYFHCFSIFSHLIFLIFSWIFLIVPYFPLRLLRDPPNSKKIWRNFPSKILIKKVIDRCRKSVFVPNSSKCAPGADAKIMCFRWIPETWSMQLGEYPSRLVMSGQSW